MKIDVKDLKNYADKEIVFEGFVDAIRDIKWVQFVVLRDSTGKVQMTIEKSLEENKGMVELISSLPLESTVRVNCKVVLNPNVKLNGMELIPSKIVVTSRSENELPFNYKDLDNVNLDTRLDYRFIDLRNDKNMKIFQIQSVIVKYMREYLYNNKFTEIHTPKLIGAASESGSDVFEVKYFDRKAYLAQSPQFYKQMAMAAGFERIFESGPVFRAEKFASRKHATEFTGFDLEFSYIESFHDVMHMEEEMLTYALKAVKEVYGEEIKNVYGIDVVVPTLPFPVMDLHDVYKELEARYGYVVPESEKGDLTTEGERLVEKLSMDMFGHEFLFITGYSKECRAFYHMRDEKGVPCGYDLIWKGCEITTGAQREHRYDVLCRQAEEKGLHDDVAFYLDFFKYGCPPHGGFGIGVDRITMILFNEGIKDAMFIFRGPDRLNP